MALNRSSYWTLLTGEKLRVKHMTIAQIQAAMFHIDMLERDELYNDPYIVQQICSNSDCCSVLPEPVHKMFGFLIEDWHNLFYNELIKRVKILTGQPIRSPKIAAKPFFLVKWFKFW